MELYQKLQASIFICICSMFLGVLSGKQRVMYTGYEVHRFVPNTKENLEVLKSLQTKNPGVIFLKQAGNTGAAVDVLFPPHLQTDLLQSLSSKMPSSLISDDMESLMTHDAHVAQLQALDVDAFPFTNYWDFAKLQAFYKRVQELHPDMVEIHHYGKSVEGRDLTAVIVSSDKTTSSKKPAMLVDGGTHAREWITVMSCAYFLNEVVSNKNLYANILQTFDIIYVCSVNPDGFTYSWEVDRMWRKNRAVNSHAGILGCMGVDPNRNYDFGHGGEGSSKDDTCAETYAGPAAFSEPETRLLRDFAEKRDIKSYTSLHSYSQLYLLSFGCPEAGPSTYTEFARDLQLANQAATAASAINGVKYACGNSNEILYPACGTSADWYKAKYGTRYAYTYELRDEGTFGFILPADQIAPCAEETAASLRVLHQTMAAQLVQAEKEKENQQVEK